MNETLPQNIDEFFAYVLHKTELPYDIRMISKLPDAPEDFTENHPVRPDEAVVVHIFEKTTSWHPSYETFISESFVKECFEGKHGGKDASFKLLVDYLDYIMPHFTF